MWKHISPEPSVNGKLRPTATPRELLERSLEHLRAAASNYYSSNGYDYAETQALIKEIQVTLAEWTKEDDAALIRRLRARSPNPKKFLVAPATAQELRYCEMCDANVEVDAAKDCNNSPVCGGTYMKRLDKRDLRTGPKSVRLDKPSDLRFCEVCDANVEVNVGGFCFLECGGTSEYRPGHVERTSENTKFENAETPSGFWLVGKNVVHRSGFRDARGRLFGKGFPGTVLRVEADIANSTVLYVVKWVGNQYTRELGEHFLSLESSHVISELELVERVMVK